MPNKRKKGKVNFGFWVTESEKKAIIKDMKRLKIDTYSDYIAHKLGLDRPPRDKGE